MRRVRLIDHRLEPWSSRSPRPALRIRGLERGVLRSPRPARLARTALRSSLPAVAVVLAGPGFVDPTSPFESARTAPPRSHTPPQPTALLGRFAPCGAHPSRGACRPPPRVAHGSLRSRLTSFAVRNEGLASLRPSHRSPFALRCSLRSHLAIARGRSASTRPAERTIPWWNERARGATGSPTPQAPEPRAVASGEERRVGRATAARLRAKREVSVCANGDCEATESPRWRAVNGVNREP